MKIWLTTDTHFNHKKLIEYGRPSDFENKIFLALNELTEKDLLIHLGDVCMGKSEEMHERFIKPLKCKKWLLKGNHDNQSVSWYLEHGWDFVAKTFTLQMYGRNIIFSHEPISLGRLPTFVNIHGHWHDNTHRMDDFKFKYTDRHKLLALEHINYGLVSLEGFLK